MNNFHTSFWASEVVTAYAGRRIRVLIPPSRPSTTSWLGDGTIYPEVLIGVSFGEFTSMMTDAEATAAVHRAVDAVRSAWAN